VEQDFTGSGNGDHQGHGTHCAGTIFGRDVAGQRIGIARGVTRALIGKVLDDNGSGRSEWLFDGLQWANQQKAQVVSMSIGFDFPGMVDDMIAQGVPRQAAMSSVLLAYRDNLRMFDAIMAMFRARAAFGTGTVVVAASGNESDRYGNPGYEIGTSLPAAADDVVAVGAVEQGAGALRVAGFSNTFPQIVAPGVGIRSAWPGNGMAVLQGTSMACPHVAGVAALWWEELVARNQVAPTAHAVASRLLTTARAQVFAADVDPADRGAGLVTAP
jgi:subtilisin family serine protease